MFRDYGYRRLRHRARIKFLVADWGAEKFREVLEKEYLGYALPDGPAPDAPRGGRRDHVGRAPAAGRQLLRRLRARASAASTATRCDVIADLAGRYGSGRVRTTTEQKMVILDVPRRADRGAGRRAGGRRPAGHAQSTFRRQHDGLHRHRVLQAGDRRDQGPGRRPDRASWSGGCPDFDEPVTINVNGCPNSCARIQIADIGLKGSARHGRGRRAGRGLPDPPGRRRAAGRPAGFGRKVRGLKTTAEELPDYVERVLRRFDAAREPGESFAAWAARASDEELS